MKALVFAILMATSAAIGADAPSAFAAKNYSEAVKLQERDAASAVPSAENYYNLGLANEKAGEPVRAALNYQRALLLDPGLSPARNAMSKLAAAHAIPVAPRAWTDDLTSFLHPDTLILGGNVLLWAGAFGLLFSIQVRRHRGVVVALSVLALAIGVVAQAAGWLSDARLASAHPAIVSAKDGAVILTAPANNSASVVTVPAGTPVGVLSPRGAWTYVDLNGGAKGWIETSRLTPVVPGETL